MGSIAIIGGTGNLGLGLARRWTLAAKDVVIGSRDAARAAATAAGLAELAQTRSIASSVRGGSNIEAARSADVVVLTVPFSHQASTLREILPVLAGKVLIDTTVPLVPPAVARVQLPPEGSAGLIAQHIVGDEVRVVSAFQNVAAHHLQSDAVLDCDVLVSGNDRDARALVIALVEAAGMRGFHAGSLANSAAAEALTSLLIFINKTYKCHAGIRITGLNEPAL